MENKKKKNVGSSGQDFYVWQYPSFLQNICQSQNPKFQSQNKIKYFIRAVNKKELSKKTAKVVFLPQCWISNLYVGIVPYVELLDKLD